MKRKTPIKDEYWWHEFLDRSYICLEMLDNCLSTKANAKGVPDKIKKNYSKAVTALAEIYQDVGQQRFDRFEDKANNNTKTSQK